MHWHFRLNTLFSPRTFLYLFFFVFDEKTPTGTRIYYGVCFLLFFHPPYPPLTFYKILVRCRAMNLKKNHKWYNDFCGDEICLDYLVGILKKLFVTNQKFWIDFKKLFLCVISQLIKYRDPDIISPQKSKLSNIIANIFLQLTKIISTWDIKNQEIRSDQKSNSDMYVLTRKINHIVNF